MTLAHTLIVHSLPLGQNSQWAISSDNMSTTLLLKIPGMPLKMKQHTVIGIPFAFCCLIYTFPYWTYRRDCDRNDLKSQLELELNKNYDDIKEDVGPLLNFFLQAPRTTQTSVRKRSVVGRPEG